MDTQLEASMVTIYKLLEQKDSPRHETIHIISKQEQVNRAEIKR